MCGISGFVDFNKKTSLQDLEKMNRTLSHRGPDGEGYGIYDSPFAITGLGHRRLSIIDLSEGGSQPQQYKSFHLTYNGEIYNYAEIKEELQKLGHDFHTHSDTEVILHAFDQWGSDCLQKFIGMFAFAIYDDQNQKLFACRDRAGVKPFNYYLQNNIFLFGSELKAMIAHPSFIKEINSDALAAFMQYGYVPAPHCIFKNTFKLKAGHYLVMDLHTRIITTSQYWNVYDSYNKPSLTISLPEAIEETERLLTNAFQYRMVSDVPVGVFLSGGYDSALVTALLQKSNTEKIKTFTIGMPDAGLNEAPFAKEIAAHLGTDHTEHYCTAKEALEIIPKLPFFYDEPFADNSAIPTMLVSAVARESVTVALSADAGDEIFAGYTRYDHIVNYSGKFRSVPKRLRKPMAGALKMIPPKFLPGIKGNVGRFNKVYSMLKDPSDRNILSAMSKHYTDAEVKHLLKKETAPVLTAFDSRDLVRQEASTLEYIMAVDYETYLTDDILQKIDRAGMSVSLEGREPFLDHRIIEWAAQLPMELKYNNGNKKFILKEILHKYVPKEMMDRPKAGFGIPIAKWLKTDLRHYVDTYLDDSLIERQHLFNLAPVQALKKSFFNGRDELAEKVWFVLMFQMWYSEWM